MRASPVKPYSLQVFQGNCQNVNVDTDEQASSVLVPHFIV